MTTEPAYTEFNLTYPLLPFNASAIDGDVLEANSPPAGTIPGILFGILVPHIICTLVIILRTWSRLFLLRKWFLDDTLILLAWVFSTSVCIFYSITSRDPPSSLLHNTTTATAATTPTSPHIIRTYLSLILYQLTLLLTKLSILTFYLRIFTASPWIRSRRLALATVVLVVLYGVPLLFMSIFQCHPSPGRFFGTPMNKCFAFVPLLIASASLHTATDAWLIVLIIPCIARLDLPPRQKRALAFVLSLSIFVIAASLTRLQLSLKGRYTPDGQGMVGYDRTGTGMANTLAFFVMTVLELDVALICASAPTLRPVVARFWPRLGMSEMYTGGGAYGDVAGRSRRSRRSRWFGGVGGRRSLEDGTSSRASSGSVDLTSVVSYHGYPWTRATATPARSKNPSLNNLQQQQQQQQQYWSGQEDVPEMPMPPVAVLSTYRTPTTLSLRSFISSIAPRSRGHTSSGPGGPGAGDRAGLLDPEVLERRRSSVGFEGYFDQYLGYGELMMESGKRRSRNLIRVDTTTATTPLRNSVVAGRWADSQESFVFGVNDPNNPTMNRLSPVLSDAGTAVAAVEGSLGLGVVDEKKALDMVSDAQNKQEKVPAEGEKADKEEVAGGDTPN